MTGKRLTEYDALTLAQDADLFYVEEEDGGEYTTKKITFLSLLESIGIYSGSGSPEGVTDADIGAIYRRLDQNTESNLYSKESGSGNTGWIAL